MSRKSNLLKRVSMVLLLVMLLITSTSCTQTDPLKSWNQNEMKTMILNFVESAKSDVPVEERIAVFDMDGTIVCEKPLWLEMNVAMMHMYREVEENPGLKEDPLYDFVYNYVNDPTNPAYEEPFEENVQAILLESYKNVSQEEYIATVETFIQNTDNPDYHIALDETFYQPMLELIQYLMDSGFQVYIVSGSEEGLIWGVTKDNVPLDREHLIGTRLSLVPNYETSDVLYRGEFFYKPKNLDDGKTENIYYQLGSKPILACGNTVDDFGMLSYASTNETYPSIGLLVNHDDADREYKYAINERHESINWEAEVKDKGWHVISMKGDFGTIFLEP